MKIWEIQIKTTKLYHYTSVRIAKSIIKIPNVKKKIKK